MQPAGRENLRFALEREGLSFATELDDQSGPEVAGPEVEFFQEEEVSAEEEFSSWMLYAGITFRPPPPPPPLPQEIQIRLESVAKSGYIEDFAKTLKECSVYQGHPCFEKFMQSWRNTISESKDSKLARKQYIGSLEVLFKLKSSASQCPNLRERERETKWSQKWIQLFMYDAIKSNDLDGLIEILENCPPALEKNNLRTFFDVYLKDLFEFHEGMLSEELRIMRKLPKVLTEVEEKKVLQIFTLITNLIQVKRNKNEESCMIKGLKDYNIPELSSQLKKLSTYFIRYSNLSPFDFPSIIDITDESFYHSYTESELSDDIIFVGKRSLKAFLEWMNFCGEKLPTMLPKIKLYDSNRDINFYKDILDVNCNDPNFDTILDFLYESAVIYARSVSTKDEKKYVLELIYLYHYTFIKSSKSMQSENCDRYIKLLKYLTDKICFISVAKGINFHVMPNENIRRVTESLIDHYLKDFYSNPQQNEFVNIFSYFFIISGYSNKLSPLVDQYVEELKRHPEIIEHVYGDILLKLYPEDDPLMLNFSLQGYQYAEKDNPDSPFAIHGDLLKKEQAAVQHNTREAVIEETTFKINQESLSSPVKDEIFFEFKEFLKLVNDLRHKIETSSVAKRQFAQMFPDSNFPEISELFYKMVLGSKTVATFRLNTMLIDIQKKSGKEGEDLQYLTEADQKLLQLLINIQTCEAGKYNGIHISYNLMGYERSVSNKQQIDEDTIRELSIMDEIHMFLEEELRRRRFNTLQKQNVHDVSYLTNLLGRELGLFFVGEKPRYDPDGHRTSPQVIAMSKQEALDQFYDQYTADKMIDWVVELFNTDKIEVNGNPTVKWIMVSQTLNDTRPGQSPVLFDPRFIEFKNINGLEVPIGITRLAAAYMLAHFGFFDKPLQP